MRSVLKSVVIDEVLANRCLSGIHEPTFWRTAVDQQCCVSAYSSLHTLCGDASSSSTTHQWPGFFSFRSSVRKVLAGSRISFVPDGDSPSLCIREARRCQQRHYHKWYYISKQVDHRISACDELYSLNSLIEVAGPRLTHINWTRILHKLVDLDPARVQQSPDSSQSMTSDQAQSPKSVTQGQAQSTKSGVRVSDTTSRVDILGSRPGRRKVHNEVAKPKLDIKDLHNRMLNQACRTVIKQAKWYDLRYTGLVLSSLARLQHLQQPLVDTLLQHASKRAQEAYTRDFASIAKGLNSLGYTSRLEWWQLAFDSIKAKLPTKRVPADSLMTVLVSAVQLGVEVPKSLLTAVALDSTQRLPAYSPQDLCQLLWVVYKVNRGQKLLTRSSVLPAPNLDKSENQQDLGSGTAAKKKGSGAGFSSVIVDVMDADAGAGVKQLEASFDQSSMRAQEEGTEGVVSGAPEEGSIPLARDDIDLMAQHIVANQMHCTAKDILSFLMSASSILPKTQRVLWANNQPGAKELINLFSKCILMHTGSGSGKYSEQKQSAHEEHQSFLRSISTQKLINVAAVYVKLGVKMPEKVIQEHSAEVARSLPLISLPFRMVLRSQYSQLGVTPLTHPVLAGLFIRSPNEMNASSTPAVTRST
ncbi:hypothetical protein CEUSTIGMA_g6976.t1 [Chlamydomonas eustigma]|uniref:RAP domain-containing protein n=1 Tax=Chlamydomonas eustigma TaxID=1157962 RepID=A0A250X8Y5_9CHLO|nr:hypothetical protein CEUSTIGMA_g6976.t1 [Chlamydomonas eustigma]|eukprot:GAX79535.1 hypothetical protein CEUSTIGMA_g6976.t1 [Chlamydomonas eustigma]